jgi:RNA polymerase sigma-70 factor (ECF subfamily)
METELVTAAQRGSRTAFDALVRAHEGPLRSFLARRVCPSAVDDILQETWLASWQALPRYSRRSRFKAWLYSIATRKCIDYYRQHGRCTTVIALEEAAMDVADPKDQYATVDTRHTVQMLLSRLPADQREVLELYYYSELTLAEIAQALDRNLSTVKSQFYRAHAVVAQNLDSAAQPDTAHGRGRKE